MEQNLSLEISVTVCKGAFNGKKTAGCVFDVKLDGFLVVSMASLEKRVIEPTIELVRKLDPDYNKYTEEGDFTEFNNNIRGLLFEQEFGDDVTFFPTNFNDGTKDDFARILNHIQDLSYVRELHDLPEDSPLLSVYHTAVQEYYIYEWCSLFVFLRESLSWKEMGIGKHTSRKRKMQPAIFIRVKTSVEEADFLSKIAKLMAVDVGNICMESPKDGSLIMKDCTIGFDSINYYIRQMTDDMIVIEPS